MPESTEANRELYHYAETYLAERERWISAAAEVVTGDPNSNPLETFPAPTEVRADGEALDLTPEGEADLREIAGKFGIGGESDIPSGAYHELIEGGLAWKVDSEAAIADAQGSLIFAGSPHREVTRADERSYLQRRFGENQEIAGTEYDMVRQLAEHQPGFEPALQPEILPFGYDITNNFALTEEQTGQLVFIGTNQGRSVLLLRVDRDNYIDESGAKKYRNQPDSAALMTFISDTLTATGDHESSVGMVTSNTYASRVIDAVRAGLKQNRKFSVGMYGRQTLADVKGEDVAQPTPINQIPGELHTIAKKLQLLRSELQD